MENFYPHVVKRINKEICEVINENIEGIEILINEQDSTDIQAIISGPEGTPYEGGRFHVKLVLTEGYPTDPPKGYFFTKIFHPNIAPATGEICVNTLKRDWKSDLGLKHILLVIRCLLLDPNPESALNEEAGRLLQEDYNEYVARARLYTDVHACHHLRNLKAVKVTHESDSHGILRDTNAPSSKKTAGKPAVQRHISATKKALKRL